MIYDIPNSNNVPFKFGSGGYSIPNGSDIPFQNARPSYSQTADMQAVINVMQLYKIGAYIKATKSSYSDLSAIEIYPQPEKILYPGTPLDLHAVIKYRLLGTSDIRAIIKGYYYGREQNLKAYIKMIYEEQKDLGGFTRPVHLAYSDLSNLVIKGFARENESRILATIKGIESDTINLRAIIDGWDEEGNILNLPAAIKSWYANNEVNLGAYLKQTNTQYLDFFAYLKTTQRPAQNLRMLIKAWSYENAIDFPGFLRTTFTGTPIDLGAYLKQSTEEFLDLQMKIRGYSYGAPINFPASIHSWQEVVLGAYILPKYAANLGAIIRAKYTVNLPTLINSYPPVQLGASIMSWALSNINALIKGVYGDHDLRASIYPIGPVDLRAYITGYTSIATQKNLRAYISSYNTKDLGAVLSLIDPVNLGAYIEAHGSFKDLACYIFPKIIHIKRFIPIAMLEHIDLTGIINSACFGTKSVNLGAYLLPKHRKDLSAYVFGMGPDNWLNLGAMINTANVRVEDRINIKLSDTNTSSSLSYTVKTPTIVYDELTFRYGNYGIKALGSYINGILKNSYGDLSAYLSPTINIAYTTDRFSPPIGRETVINIAKGEDYWEREVELFFSEAASYYFFVAGASKIYKENRYKRWVIRVEGFEYTSDKRVERGKVRAKYIFNLEDYRSIDEAIIDAIDRVSMFRRSELGAYIKPTGGFKNLRSRILPYGYTYKSNRFLSASITGVV